MKKLYTFYLLFLSLTFASIKLMSAVVIVQAKPLEFSPMMFYVNVGDVIVWQLNTTGYHTTTSALIPAGAIPWNGYLDAMHPSFSYTINAAGDYDYICLYDSATALPGHFTAFNTVTGMADNASPLSFINHEIADGVLTINYTMPSAGITTIRLYDLTGKSTLINTSGKAAGKNTQRISVAHLPKGIYIIQLSIATTTLTRRIIIE